MQNEGSAKVRQLPLVWVQALVVHAVKMHHAFPVRANYSANSTATADTVVALFVAILTLSSQGCMTSSRDKPIDSRALSLESASNIVHYEPFSKFDLAAIVSAHQQPSVEVICTKAAEISRQSPESGLEGFAVGLGVGVLLALPTAGQSLAFFPAATVSGILNSTHRNSVLRAFQEIDFPNRIGDFLRKRLSEQYGGEPSSAIEVQVIIRKYKIWGEDCTRLWFYCDGELRVVRFGRVIFSDQLVWRALKRSSDLPPPRYATLGDYAQHDGQLVREILTEAAEILAAAVAKRLRGL